MSRFAWLLLGSVCLACDRRTEPGPPSDAGAAPAAAIEPGDGGDDRTVLYHHRACADGDAGGCQWLAAHELGDAEHGIEPDLRACDADGGADACRRAADAMIADCDLALDYRAAAALYEKSCNGGSAESCLALANIVGRDVAGPPDPARAGALAHRAYGDKVTKVGDRWRLTGRRVPTLRSSATTVNHRLSSAVIFEMLALQAPEFRFCWEGRGIPAGRGSMPVKLVIGRDGDVAVSTFEPSRSTNVDLPTATCITNVLREMHFPQPEGGVVVVNDTLELEYSGK